MSVMRVPIKHIEFGNVDIEISEINSTEDVDELARDAFDNGNATMTS